MTNEDRIEAIERLEDEMSIVLETESGYDYEVGPAEDWVGGEGVAGYISEVMGNVVYPDAKEVLNDTIEFLEKQGEKIKLKW